jgi:uncharacterized protein (DUF1330 family)
MAKEAREDQDMPCARIMAVMSIISLTALLGGAWAQDKVQMPALVIAEIEVTNPEAFSEYAPQVQSSFAPFGGRYLARGGITQSLVGEAPKRVVVIVFENMERAQAWYASPAYDKLKALRDRAGNARIFIVEGLKP